MNFWFTVLSCIFFLVFYTYSLQFRSQIGDIRTAEGWIEKSGHHELNWGNQKGEL